jgi:hypothetical protein
MSQVRSCRDDEVTMLLTIINSAADWAIGFYQRHGFALCPRDHSVKLLRTYWTIPDRQVHCSVVLANPPLAAP